MSKRVEHERERGRDVQERRSESYRCILCLSCFALVLLPYPYFVVAVLLHTGSARAQTLVLLPV